MPCGTCTFWDKRPVDAFHLGGPEVGDCYGVPPQAILVPAGAGQMAINFVRPQLAVDNRVCALFKERGDA